MAGVMDPVTWEEWSYRQCLASFWFLLEPPTYCTGMQIFMCSLTFTFSVIIFSENNHKVVLYKSPRFWNNLTKIYHHTAFDIINSNIV